MNQNYDYHVTSAAARLWRDRPGGAVLGTSTAARRGLTRPTRHPDGDGISNLDEYLAGTSPVRPNGMNLGGTHKSVTLASTAAPKAYDVYYRAPGGTKWRRISSGVPGQKAFNFVNPNQSQEGDFIFLDANDTDGDGLSDGYEGWFTYDGQRTNPHDRDSNLDRMQDGWKVLYGLDPLDATGINDPEYIVSGDTLSSEDKHEEYYDRLETLDLSYASYDPLHVTASASVRPVVRIAPAGETAFNVASFTITRDVGSGGSLSSALTVYYAVGGTLKYGVDFDYILDPAPLQVHYPNVFAVEIPQNQASVVVTVILLRDSMPGGDKNVTATLTSFDTVE